MLIRGASRRRLVALVMIVVLVVLTVLPARYCVYGPVLHGGLMAVVRFVSWPLARVSDAARGWVDPPEPVMGNERELDAKIKRLENRLFKLETDNTELRRQLAWLQALDAGLLSRQTATPRIVRVVAQGAGGEGGTVELGGGTNLGFRQGLPVLGGLHPESQEFLVGRLIQVGPTTSTLALITARDTQLNVQITPAQMPESDLPPDRQGLCRFIADGSPRLSADDVNAVPRTQTVEIGDLARLSDDDWLPVVQGTIVGRVVALKPLPQEPQLKSVTIKTLANLAHLGKVTVLVPDEPVDSPELLHP
jgi:cell shape-determining protein MreC